MGQFKRKTTVSAVAIYTDFRHDESYTPSKVSVRCGTNFNDLQEIEVVELKEPSGWVKIPLKDLNDRLVRSFMVQIAVLSNHQQGRDTHLRQIKSLEIHEEAWNAHPYCKTIVTNPGFMKKDFKLV